MYESFLDNHAFQNSRNKIDIYETRSLRTSHNLETVTDCKGYRTKEIVTKVNQPLNGVIDRLANGERVPAEESMQYEMLRLCSFKSYPQENKPFLIRYAQAGFYYAGKGDEVICYVCRKRFSQWSADDIPIDVHRRNSPNCRFLTINSEVNVSVDSVGNNPINQSQKLSCYNDQTVTRLPTALESTREGACSTPNDMVNSYNLEKKLNSLSDKSERNSFPKDCTHSNTEYRDNSDKNLSSKKVYSEKYESLPESENSRHSVCTEDRQKILKDLKRENEELRLMTYCSICKTKEVCVVFLPCGHLVSCDECAPRIKNCIYCSNFIKGTVHTFRA